MAPGNVTPFGGDHAVPESEQIVMRCCKKTREFMRDCECRVPNGPCMAPGLVFTHYRRECQCFSCEWLNGTKNWSIRNQTTGGPEDQVYNPAFAGDKPYDELEADSSGPGTNLELVYPVLLSQNAKRWEWVFRPVNEAQLPFLAHPSQSSGVAVVTLGSSGQWKALREDGTSFPLSYDTRPVLNELYTDYGYAPQCSPVSILHPSLA